MADEKNYITPDGFKKLQDEAHWFVTVERPRITEIVHQAALLGDRSENADYQYGKLRLGEIDGRIQFLNKRIDSAIIVDPSKITTDRIQFGATVVIEDENGIGKNYVIVGADESDASKGHISWRSPVGRALLGKEIGDVVSVRTPRGDVEIEIIEVKYLKVDIEAFNAD
ncbi:MAG: transcription elongation factor GreB [Bacteriovoracaceae bacterium]|nr:transcription elongation factor GreB [Bacteriovoracaceae bacterium]